MKRLALFSLLFVVCATQAAPPAIAPDLYLEHWGYKTPGNGDEQWVQFSWDDAPVGTSWMQITGYLELYYPEFGFGWLVHDARQYHPWPVNGGTSDFMFEPLPDNLGVPVGGLRLARIRLKLEWMRYGILHTAAHQPDVWFVVKQY